MPRAAYGGAATPARRGRRKRDASEAVADRLLLDTHAFLWFVTGDERLSVAARTAIEDPAKVVVVSAASAWEISIKRAAGKLPDEARFEPSLAAYLQRRGFTALEISVMHGEKAGDLPLIHRDPFDRMLIAQAVAEDMAIVSNETVFDEYGVPRLW